MGVNFKAMVNISQAVSRKMIAHGKEGTIVNVASIVKQYLKHHQYNFRKYHYACM